MNKNDKQELFGPNIWLVDEMYRQYQENPKAVGESWREFFEDYVPNRPEPHTAVPNRAPDRDNRTATATAPSAKTATTERRPDAAAGDGAGEQSQDKPAPTKQQPLENAAPLRGVAARIAANMEASLELPTATSVRTIPAKLLEENRRVINRYLAGHRGGRVSFTHLIGWAILKSLEAHPQMKSSYAEIDGKPHVVENKHVNFGLAVDVQRPGGGRSLLVPNLRNVDELDFASFFAAYEEVIRKVKKNELSPDDFAGTTVTLTNPGTVGTSLSVPRLMPGQGLIVGAGAIGYPPEFQGADPANLAQIGLGKVITLTSTYDHRVIQGAESGEFLAYIQELVLGEHRFFDELFVSLKIPYEPVRWSHDTTGVDDQDAHLEKQSRVSQLINMYRVRGHLLAELNPISWEVLSHPELDLSHYGLTVWDLDREFLTDGLAGPRKQPLRGIIDTLRDAYCHKIGVEFMHISDPAQKRWIQRHVEPGIEDYDKEEKKHILDRLNAAEAFEKFLHSKYVGHRRYSIEGADSLIPMLDSLLERAADDGMVESVVGMSHRGRLNVLANIIGKPLTEIFDEFEGNIDPNTVQGSGDVKYHVGLTGSFTSRAGQHIGVVMASNPSHLESVDPVVEGMARGKQDLFGDDKSERILPLLVHGDAAFAGQGVVAETFNMSQLPGYKTGGTVHVVVNNLIGFTTAPDLGRSTTYATDIAKMVQAPIFHVNGDDPEACVRVVRLAYEFRKAFKKDVVIDLFCYRLHGHQEVDEPSFTQPLMYQHIYEHRSVRKLYTESLLNRGDLSVEEAEKSLDDFRGKLQHAFEETKGTEPPQEKRQTMLPHTGVIPSVATGVARERLDRVQEVLTTIPRGFRPHPKLAKMIERRADMLVKDAVDWAGAESLAFGSLLLEGIPVRLSGQDSRRGTFNQRHSVWIDYNTEEEFMPLANLEAQQASVRIYDSLLSEFAALGFDYGYSVANGDALVCWEAQFGDFVNGGQVIIDGYIVAGEDKWDQKSGLAMLLPHGYEGQGPEHSSARLERFLGLCAEDNIQVTQPTTPAQYFHLLRRQVHRSMRKPLIVMTPKSLLRSPKARSTTTELTGGRFRETLDDPNVADKDAVTKVLLCTGKVAYNLLAERDERAEKAAVVRMEQLYPFPEDQIFAILDAYPNARDIRWVQEEPENMGAWHFILSRLSGRLDERFTLHHITRTESASPAAGSTRMHEFEQEQIVARAFADFV